MHFAGLSCLRAAGSTHPFKSLSAPLPLGTDPSRPSAFVSDGLNQFARFPFDAVVRTPWAGCHNSAADCLALKGFSVARTTIVPGVVVDVYDLHMEAGGDPEDDVLRDQGVTQLSTFIQSYSAGRPVIVGGDFNLHTNGGPTARSSSGCSPKPGSATSAPRWRARSRAGSTSSSSGAPGR